MHEKLSLLIELAAGADGAPPREFQLFPAGEVRTRKGTFLFDEKAATATLAAARAWGVRLAIDYCHASLGAMTAPDPAKAGEAAGSFVPAVREGALWATDVEWTPDGAERVASKKYRYFSPTILTDANKRVCELINVALTNTPATHGIAPLVLAAGEDNTKEGERMKGLLAVLGLSADALEADAVARATELSGFVRELETVTGQTGRAALGVVRAGIESAKQCTALAAELATLRVAETVREVDAAVTAGKLAPALKPWALEYGAKDRAGFVAYLSALPVSVVTAETKREPATKGAVTALSDADRAVCAQLGISEAEFAKSNAAQGEVQ